MKRLIICLALIFVFVVSAVLFDQWYMDQFGAKMADGLNEVADALKNDDSLAMGMDEINQTYHKARPVLSLLVFSNRLEDVETALYRLNAYVGANDREEIYATIEELRARVLLLSSSQRYYRNQNGR